MRRESQLPNAATLSCKVRPRSDPAISALYTERGNVSWPGVVLRRLFRTNRCRSRLETSQRALFALTDRRTTADHHRHSSRLLAVRVIERRLRRSLITSGQQRIGAVSQDAFRIWAGQGQAGEELGGHAATTTRIKVLTLRACTGALRCAKLGEQIGVAPHVREPALVQDVPGKKVLVNSEGACIDIADGSIRQTTRPAPQRLSPGSESPYAAR